MTTDEENEKVLRGSQEKVARILTYECRLRKAGVIRVKDVGDQRTIERPKDLVRVAQRLMRHLPHEQCWVILLNHSNEIAGAVRVSEGGISAAAMTPSDVLRPVLVGGAPAFVLAHNHPSGDPKPSVADLSMTQTLVEGARLLGLRCLDHVIVTADPKRWTSFARDGIGGFDGDE